MFGKWHLRWHTMKSDIVTSSKLVNELLADMSMTVRPMLLFAHFFQITNIQIFQITNFDECLFHRKYNGHKDPVYGMFLIRIGEALQMKGRIDEARIYLKRGANIAQAVYGTNHLLFRDAWHLSNQK